MFSRAGILRAGMWGVMWLAVFFVGVRSLDPDFGWHIQMGNLILAGGVPQTDPFSYTMANFPFIDHEWLTNTIIAVLYPRVGMAGLAVIFATIVLGTIWVAVPKSEWMWADLPVMLGFTVFLGRAGVRPQIMDWLFLAIVLRLLADDRLWKKWKAVPLRLGLRYILFWVDYFLFSGWLDLCYPSFIYLLLEDSC